VWSRAQPRLANGCLGLRIYLSPKPPNQPKFQIPAFYTALVQEFWLADRFVAVFGGRNFGWLSFVGKSAQREHTRLVTRVLADRFAAVF
jgi:hypothetical protein